ncbi:MAG: hypothetical protein ACU0CA_03255 [Paracoccaceae bacterium]
MGVLEDLADNLAKDTLEFAEKSGDEHVVDDVSTIVGSTSATLQEAYLTSVRVRLAEARGRKLLKDRLAGKPRERSF